MKAGDDDIDAGPAVLVGVVEIGTSSQGSAFNVAYQYLALQPIVTPLDELIRRSLSDLQYAVKWKKAYYGTPDLGWIIEMVAYDVSVNVVFLGGADFDAPPPLGDSDRSRYVKLKTEDELDQPDLTGWIENAGRVPGWR